MFDTLTLLLLFVPMPLLVLLSVLSVFKLANEGTNEKEEKLKVAGKTQKTG